MRDVTNEVKDFKKYYIIPKDEIAFIVHSGNADHAMECFAWAMDSDMNRYFRAVTEEEYEEIKRERNLKGAHDQFIDWAHDVLQEDFDDYEFDKGTVDELAEDAWDINCEGEGYTEYECIQEAVDRYRKGA